MRPRNARELEQHVGYQRSKRSQRVALIGALKEDTPCADCGNHFPACAMEFDHLPGFSKEFEIGSRPTAGIKRLQAEIDKCQIVCSNCHRVRTRDRGYVS